MLCGLAGLWFVWWATREWEAPQGGFSGSLLSPAPGSGSFLQSLLDSQKPQASALPHMSSSASLRGFPQTLSRTALPACPRVLGRVRRERDGRVAELGARGCRLHSGAGCSNAVCSLSPVEPQFGWIDPDSVSLQHAEPRLVCCVGPWSPQASLGLGSLCSDLQPSI